MPNAGGNGTVSEVPKPESRRKSSHYDANYDNFQTELYGQIRSDAFGEDIGQNSWLTVSEQDKFLTWLNLSPGRVLLDVACGAGGPALRIAATTGCSVIGIDIHEKAIATANKLAAERGLAPHAEFRVVDAAQKLPFPDAGFDAITCIDAINHFPDRQHVIADWTRLLKWGGRLLFTDPIVVTGPLTNTEVTIRSSAGFYLLVPIGHDEIVLAQCGLSVLASENVTRNVAEIAGRRMATRAARETALREVEGDRGYEAQQDFLKIAAQVAQEGRLSRFMLAAEKSREHKE